MLKETQKTVQELRLKKAAIYARVSSRKQKEEETIESQVEALKQYAQSNGYYLNENFIFLDNGVSGSTLQRPALDELRDVIQFEPIEALLVYAPDRLARDYTHQLILMEEFRKRGVNLCFLKNPPTADSKEAKMLQHFQGIFAEYERALILDRSRRGRFYKAKQGDLAIIPSFPYGYKKVKTDGKTSVIIMEEEAEIVREIFRLYIYESFSIRKLSQKLTDDNIKTRKGAKKWPQSVVRGILANPAYLGTSYYGKTERCEGSSDRIRKRGSKVFLKAKHARKKRLQEEWIPISIPQIISENDYELAQERLKQNKALASRNTKAPSLLQGLIICGECGHPFYKRVKESGKNEKKRIGYYYCRSKSAENLKSCSNKAIHQEVLDKHVFEEVCKLLKTPSLIQQELERRAKEASSTEETAQREVILKKEIAKLSYERDRLLDAYQSGAIELKQLKERCQKLETLKKSIEKEVEGIKVLKLEAERSFDLGKLFENIFQRMQNKAETLTFDEKRKLILLLVEEVIVNEDTIELVHCISPRAIAAEGCLLRSDGRGRALASPR